MLKEFFLLTLKGIRYRPIRGWLTILGVVIGIMLVVMILSLSSGIQSSISKSMQMFGSNLVVIFPGKSNIPIVNLLGNEKFKERDLMKLEELNGVDYLVPVERGVFITEYKGEQKSSMFNAAPWSGMVKTFEESQGVSLIDGRWPVDENVREVVVGYGSASNLFRKKMLVGQELVVKSKRLKIVGIMSEIGNQVDDNVLYVSMNIFREFTGSPAVAGMAFAKVKSDHNINLVVKQMEFQLSKQEVVRDFTMLTPDKSERIIGDVLGIVELSLISIAFISLLVGAVGIMNTMYTSVLERTKQIGIMKAIGASNDAILFLFLIESGVIGMVGGVLGIFLGVFFAYLIGVLAASFGIAGLFSFAALDFFGLAAILMVTFITGVLSGIFPARHAARMEPAEALRYE